MCINNCDKNYHTPETHANVKIRRNIHNGKTQIERLTTRNGQRSGSRYESHSRLDTGSTSIAPSTDEGRLRRNAAHLALPGKTTGCSGGEKRTSLTSVSPVAECHRQRRQCSTATAEPASPLLDGNDLERAHPRPRQRRSVLHVVTFLQLNRSLRCNSRLSSSQEETRANAA